MFNDYMANREYNKEIYGDFIPEHVDLIKGARYGRLYERFEKVALANNGVEVFFEDWEEAVSLYIAHKMQMNIMQNEKDHSASELAKEIIQFVEDKDRNYEMFTQTKENTRYWNHTIYGQRYSNLHKMYAVLGGGLI